MKARATDNDVIWESYNVSTPVKPEDLTPAQSSVPATEVQPEQSSEPVPQVSKENYADFFSLFKKIFARRPTTYSPGIKLPK